MTDWRVGTGRGRVPFHQALHSSAQGDAIYVEPGFYRYPDGFSIRHLRIIGEGPASEVVLETFFEVQKPSLIANLTLRAPHFQCAVNILTADARADIDQVHIHAEPSGKYVPIYVKAGSANVTGSFVAGDANVRRSAKLTADSSHFERICVTGGTVNLINSNAKNILGKERARIESSGGLILQPGSELAFRLSGESLLLAGSLEIRGAENPSAIVESSYVDIGQLILPRGQELSLTADETATTKILGAPVARSGPEKPQTEATEPKTVHWRKEDAGAYWSKIHPQLAAGDTLLLDEGRYALTKNDDAGKRHFIGPEKWMFDIVSKGDPAKTKIEGCLIVAGEHPVHISGVTVVAPEGVNALQVCDGAQATLSNVTLERSGRSETPVAHVQDGGTLIASGLTAMPAEPDADVQRRFDVSGTMSATSSSFDQLVVVGGQVTLRDVEVTTVIAENSTIRSTGRLWSDSAIRTARGKRLLHLTGGEAHCEEVVAEGDATPEMFCSGDLVIDAFWADDDALAYLFVEDDGDRRIRMKSGTLEIIGDEATVQVTTSEPETASADEPEHGPAGDSEQPVHATATSPSAEIEALEGLARVKKQIADFTRMVRFNKFREDQGLKVSDVTMHSMFLGNPGTGKTTVARLLGRVLFEAGAIASDTFVEVTRDDLVSENIGGTALKTRKKLEEALGGVLFIDEAYALANGRGTSNDFGGEALTTILKFMEDHRRDIVVIVAGYADRMQEFLSMNPGLKSRIPNRFDFEDYSPSEIARIGLTSLENGDYRVEDAAAYRKLVERRYAVAADKSNGRWIRNFNDELLKVVAERVVSKLETDPDAVTVEFSQQITTADLEAVAGGDVQGRKQRLDELLSELDALVGLEPVKRWVRELIEQVDVDTRRAELDGAIVRPAYHMVFTGNPGTGKTTVARIVAQLFAALGILETSHVKEVDRSQLVGRWIGQTEELTRNAVDESLGGVLFIDEAYQLTSAGSENDFGKQAIETLLTRLEDDRDKFVAIFAGYSTEMEQFLGANPGLRSRIPLTIEFPDYSPVEIGEIVARSLRAQNWKFTEALAKNAAAAAYERMPTASRANARTARLITENIVKLQRRWILDGDLTGADMQQIPGHVFDALAAGE